MDLAKAETDLTNNVYEAVKLLEQLQFENKLDGNGHHARQAIAQFAVAELRARWHNRQEAEAAEAARPNHWMEQSATGHEV